jgi:hypothetical protein
MSCASQGLVSLVVERDYAVNIYPLNRCSLRREAHDLRLRRTPLDDTDPLTAAWRMTHFAAEWTQNRTHRGIASKLVHLELQRAALTAQNIAPQMHSSYKTGFEHIVWVSF